MKCTTWSKSKAKTIPEEPDERLACDHDPKLTVRQIVSDILLFFLAMGVLLGAVYFRTVLEK